MVDLILLLIFLASSAMLAVFISQKVPALISVSDKILDESFLRRPPRITVFADAIRSFFEWRQYENIIISGSEKVLRRIRILIIKGDALVSRLLVRLQDRGKALAAEDKQYLLRDLKDWKKSNGTTEVPNILPRPVSSKEDTWGIKKFFKK